MKIATKGNGLIFATLAGSHLYGTSRPESDVDIRGVCLPPKDSIFGLEHFDQFLPGKSAARAYSAEQFGIVSDDVQIYSLPKFLSLLMDANPNIIELLFATGESVLYQTSHWLEIVERRDWFLSNKIIHSFAGYAYSQLQRIQRHKRWLDSPPEKPDPADYMGEFVEGAWVWREPTKDQISALVAHKILEFSGDDWGKEFAADLDDLYRRAARKKEYQANMREWQHYQTWVKNRNPARSELEQEYGYDVKHAMHLYRLIFEAEELLATGRLTLPLKPDTVQFLKRILKGEIEYEQVVAFAEAAHETLKAKESFSVLRHSPDRKRVNEMLSRMLYDHFYSCEY